VVVVVLVLQVAMRLLVELGRAAAAVVHQTFLVAMVATAEMEFQVGVAVAQVLRVQRL
jgi:hypothetical protein